MRYGLTPRQKAVFDFIDNYIVENGYSPTYREIMSAVSSSSLSAIHAFINILSERGWITKIAGSSRSISIKVVSNEL